MPCVISSKSGTTFEKDDPEAADRVEAELLGKCESLARMPGQGHRRPDYTMAPVLFFPVYSYLIVYRPGTDPLQIWPLSMEPAR